MKVIVHGMGGVINEVWAYTPENIYNLALSWYPSGEVKKELNEKRRKQLVYDLTEKSYHSYLDSEEGYSELVVMEVIE